MNEKANAKPKATLLDAPRADLGSGLLPRCPDFPASNYTYMKRCEAMREHAAEGRDDEVRALMGRVAGSNTYARASRAYGQLLLAWLGRDQQLGEVIEAIEAQVAKAAEDPPHEKARKAANAATANRKVKLTGQIGGWQ